MTLETLGTSFSRLNQHALACEVFGRLVDLHPEHPAYRFNFATSLVFCGQVESAELQFVRCLELDPGFWKAYPALAKLRKQTPERNHLERFLAVLPDAGGDAAIYLHMALAKEYEDLGEYPIAFDHLALGKAIARKPKRYSFSRDQAVFEAVQSHFVPGPEGRGHPAREPIFVFGMPRSGTTLVERILSSHPDVRASGEREDFAIALKRASGSATPLMLDPDTVARSTNLDWRAVGRDYMASIGSRSGERFVDKLPQNFLYAGYIANALPLAKMICVRRNPMDTCLGNFRQLFPLASPYYDYSLDIGDIGRYFIMFDRLMSYWERLLPGRILSVQYETLVEEQESCTRAILDFCGLSWNEQCLRFERNASPVATASTLQVREPMNRESMNRWTLYRPQLESLRQLLGAAGIEVPG